MEDGLCHPNVPAVRGYCGQTGGLTCRGLAVYERLLSIFCIGAALIILSSALPRTRPLSFAWKLNALISSRLFPLIA